MITHGWRERRRSDKERTERERKSGGIEEGREGRTGREGKRQGGRKGRREGGSNLVQVKLKVR